MQAKLSKLVPDVELRIKAELVYEINRLKKERGAIILGHNYMEAALYHTVADVVGDSLELSRKAAETDCDPIIFCGVRFMAETAKILNPNKTVLLPAKVAGCSLASSITAEDVRDLKRRYPGVPVVSYINTYADVKAESDYICTSGNAARLVQSINSDTIIFLPDEFLASNVAKETGKKILFHDAETDFYVLAHVQDGGKKGTPHSHGESWAIYGNVTNVTRMTEYERVNPPEEEAATLRKTRVYDVGPGETFGYPPGMIHSTEHPQKAWVVRVTGCDLDALPRYRFRKFRDTII